MNKLIQHAMDLPMLTIEEERKLVDAYYNNGCLDAAKELVSRHMKLVVGYAKRFTHKFEMADLVQEGCIGLMKALKAYDPTRGIRFCVTARIHVRECILNYIVNNTHVVKIATTKEQRLCFFNLHSYRADRTIPFTSAEVKQIADDLNVRESTVREMEERMFQGHNISTDPVGSNADAPFVDLFMSVPGPEEEIINYDWTDKHLHSIEEAVSQLDVRSQDIIYHRWAVDKPVTLRELAVKHNISAERARQLESIAIKTIKQQVQINA